MLVWRRIENDVIHRCLDSASWQTPEIPRFQTNESEDYLFLSQFPRHGALSNRGLLLSFAIVNAGDPRANVFTGFNWQLLTASPVSAGPLLESPSTITSILAVACLAGHPLRP